jgi:general secretion pathway protein L
MPVRLLLRLAPDGGLSWLRGAGTRDAATQAGVPPAAVLAAADSIEVLVPAEEVLLAQATVQARSRAQRLQALPYAIEDQLLAPVEELHFAVAPGVEGESGIAVVAKDRLRGWLDGLAAQGIHPDRLLPESLALPLPEQGAVALVEASRAVVRLARWSAFACAPEDLPSWLAHAGATTVVVHDVRAGAAPLAFATRRETLDDPLAWLAAGTGASGINLLEGDFAPRNRRAGGERWWRVAAALAAAVVLLGVANLGADVLRLGRDAARLDTLAEDAVRAAIPDVDATQLARLGPQRLLDDRLQRLRGGGEAGGVLRALADIAPVLGTTTRVQTRAIEYRNGTLELALRTPDVALLDRVRERLAGVPGVQADVTAANPGADGVDGRLRITGVAAP